MGKIRQDAALLARLYAAIYDRAWRILDNTITSDTRIEYVQALAEGPEGSAHLLRPYVIGLARNPDVVTAYEADPGSVTDDMLRAVVVKVWKLTAPSLSSSG
jgi:hypothetical protein